MFTLDNVISIRDKVRRNVLVSTDHGLMIVNRFDCNHEMVGHGQWLLDHGSASSYEVNVIYDYVRNISEPIIFDVGSNIGTFATFLAKLLPKSKIYCFEPQRIIFQMLCGNLAINNFDNCYTYNIGLSNSDGFIKLKEPDYQQHVDFGTFSLINDIIEKTSGIEYMVQMMTLDSFFESFKIPKLNFLKIDVEGMDVEVLKGGKNTIKKYNPGILIEHSDNRRSILNEILDYLGLDNYNFKTYENNLLALPK
jgi:FkbM family methyltransferase